MQNTRIALTRNECIGQRSHQREASSLSWTRRSPACNGSRVMVKKTRTQTEEKQEQPLHKGSSSTMPQREERENENESESETIVKETVKVKAERDIYTYIWHWQRRGFGVVLYCVIAPTNVWIPFGGLGLWDRWIWRNLEIWFGRFWTFLRNKKGRKDWRLVLFLVQTGGVFQFHFSTALKFCSHSPIVAFPARSIKKMSPNNNILLKILSKIQNLKLHI